jgi:PAS domain S-box-containing protein
VENRLQKNRLQNDKALSQEKVDILLVDDRRDGLITLEAVLSNDKYNLVTALSGKEALALLPLYDFALILLDVQMPILDGFETAALMKNEEEFRDIPILFVTAINKDDRYMFKGYETGAVDYIFKPFDPYILRSKVAVFVDLFLKTKRIRIQEARLREIEQHERFRHLAELELENLRRYRNLADAIPHIVCKAKADGTLDYFNRVWTDYTGLSLEQSVGGTGWHSGFHAQDLPHLLKVWVDGMIRGVPFETEARVFFASTGEWRWNLVRGTPECNRQGDIQAWIGTCTDIHDRKQSEVELARAKEVAESANRAKTHFLANMSHEIRTPLSAILGFTELMLNPAQTVSDRLHSVQTIRRNGSQLLHIIDEILDISKVEAGRLEIEMLEVDIESLVLELHNLLELKALDKGLLLSFECISKIPKYVTTDPTRLRQILLNIVGNALKFTEHGHVEVSIGHILKPGESDALRILVKDTGVGLTSEQSARLFQPFMQVDSSTSRRFGGTGLGLALSRRLARALGGDVRILQTSLNSGSTFEIEIPTGPIQRGVFIDSLNAKASATPPKPNTILPDALEGLKVLLVEDAPDNQALISRFLKMAGASVELASNGAEGVEKASSGDYDAVLMDIQMPILDGYEATAKLRSLGFAAPIIALTAHALKEERQRCLNAGCSDHLTKPIDRIKLIERLAQVKLEKTASPPSFLENQVDQVVTHSS